MFYQLKSAQIVKEVRSTFDVVIPTSLEQSRTPTPRYDLKLSALKLTFSSAFDA